MNRELNNYHILDRRTTVMPRCVKCGKPMSKWRAGDECSGKKPKERKT